MHDPNGERAPDTPPSGSASAKVHYFTLTVNHFMCFSWTFHDINIYR